MQSITPPPDQSSTTSTASKAITLMVELAEIGRAVELHTEPWAWPTAQRIFRAQAELRHIVAETWR